MREQRAFFRDPRPIVHCSHVHSSARPRRALSSLANFARKRETLPPGISRRIVRAAAPKNRLSSDARMRLFQPEEAARGRRVFGLVGVEG